MLTREEQERLLRVARQALDASVLGLAFDERGIEPIGIASGAFVSIHRRTELRGCLGRLEPLPLIETVTHLARAVADSDPRFPPVRPEELAEIDIEISVLTPERRIESPADIDVGRHGVVVEHHGRRGLLLPQVAVEHGWDRLTFLEHTCLKAGLTREAWTCGARICVFEAEVFGEHDIDAVEAGRRETRNA